MRRWLSALLMLSMAGSAHAQTPAKPERRTANVELAVTGMAATVVGVLMMVGVPEGENVTVYGDTSCVINGVTEFDIKRGSCQSTPMVKAGAITAAAGGVLMVIGLRRVTVKPQIGPHSVRATVTVRF